jgi:transposase
VALPALTDTFQHYLRTVDEARARHKDLESLLQSVATGPPYAATIARLRCFRRIDTLSALILAVEVGDPRRFDSAPALMAFVGLVPSEHSSGPRRWRGGITRTGNAHLPRILVAIAWHYRHQPYLGRPLRRRQEGQPRAVCAAAWHAQLRLHRRYRHLVGHGKRSSVAVVAVPRELTGFVWAALTTIS